MAMVMWMAAAYQRTNSPSRLAWSEGWRPPGAESAFRQTVFVCVSLRICLAYSEVKGRMQGGRTTWICMSLRPRDRCPRDTALAATPGTGQLQTGAYGIPSAERYGAIVPESTRSGIKPARPSPVTVVVHTTAARPRHTVCQQSAVARFLLQPPPSGTLYPTTFNLHHLFLPFAGS